MSRKPATTPWRPAALLDSCPAPKDKNFTYRWVRKEPNRFERMKSEGWEIVSGGDCADGTFTRKELVLMRIPKPVAESRNKFYQDMTGNTVASSEDILRQGSADGIYGSITVEDEGG